MPEIKHTFQGGKMNKDLDERLVPNGQYRDAMNIQVRTTDGDAAGTIQNLQGNSTVGGSYYVGEWHKTNNAEGKMQYPHCLASVADEKSDKAYFFFASPPLLEADITANTTEKCFIDTIIELDAGGNTVPVFVDIWTIDQPVINTLGTDFVNGTFDGNGGIPITTTQDIENFQNVGNSEGGVISELIVVDSSKYRIGMIIEAYGPIYEVVDDVQTTIQSGDLFLNTYTNPFTGEELTGKNPKIKDIQVVDGVHKILFHETHPVEHFVDASHFVFRHDKTLNFKWQDDWITGVNVIDDLLFWTDNTTEPKRINITNCKEGTLEPYYNNHTKLIVEHPVDNYPINISEIDDNLGSDPINSDIQEKNITVIKRAPRTAPTLDMKSTIRPNCQNVNITNTFVNYGNDQTLDSGEIEQIESPSLENSDFRRDDILIITQTSDNTFTPIVIKAKFISYEDSNNEEVLESTTRIRIKILSISSNGNNLTPTANTWVIDLEEKKPLFERKMVRFGYRYKYEDGEYSSFSPWSEIAFLPSEFDYNAKEAYNLGMANNIRRLVIKDFIPYKRPLQIKEIDILYKATDSANVYVAATVTRGKNSEWELFTPDGVETIDGGDGEIKTGQLTVTSEMVHRVLPSTQILRGWDNVPRYALAQEITGNRLVYGNYTQGYDIKSEINLLQEIVSTKPLNFPQKSIKSIRDYKVGMVFGDKYGRETPVINSGYSLEASEGSEAISGDVSIEKTLCAMQNRFKLTMDWDDPPSWLQDGGYVKYYVKETSNEYYNLVMDRWYDSGDDTIWLSFNSADRNKVDEETYLLLKNRNGTNDPVLEKARYKIISIKNEAPDYIKTEWHHLGEVTIGPESTSGIWVGGDAGDEEQEPPEGLWDSDRSMEIWGGTWNTGSQGQIEMADGDTGATENIFGREVKGQVEMQVIGRVGNLEHFSGWRRISHWTRSEDGVRLSWKDRFSDNATNGANMWQAFNCGVGCAGLTYSLRFREAVIENLPEFDGKFFVKIAKDEILTQEIINGQYVYKPVGTYNLSYIESATNNQGDESIIDQELNTTTRTASFDNSIGGVGGGPWFYDAFLGAFNLSNETFAGDDNFGLARWNIDNGGGTHTSNWGNAENMDGNLYNDGVYSYTNELGASMGVLPGETEELGNWYLPPLVLDSDGDFYVPGSGLTYDEPGWSHKFHTFENMYTMGGYDDTDPSNDGILGYPFPRAWNFNYYAIGLQQMGAVGKQYPTWWGHNEWQPADIDIDGTDGLIQGPSVMGQLCGPANNQLITPGGVYLDEDEGWTVYTGTNDPFVQEGLGETNDYGDQFGVHDYNLRTKKFWKSYSESNGSIFIDAAGARRAFGGPFGNSERKYASIEWDAWTDNPAKGNEFYNNMSDVDGADSNWDNQGFDPGYVDFYKYQGMDSGIFPNIDGTIFGTADGTIGRMFISYLKTNEDNLTGEINALLTTQGTMFSFPNAPLDENGEAHIYRVIWVDRTYDVHNFSLNITNFSATSIDESILNVGDEIGWMCNSCGGYNVTESDSGGPYNSSENPSWMPSIGDYEPMPPSIADYQDVCIRKNTAIEFRRVNRNNNVTMEVGLSSDYDPRSWMHHDGRDSVYINIMDYDNTVDVDGNSINNHLGACWETEPKESVDVDLYYEASNSIPMVLDSENSFDYIPVDSSVSVTRQGIDGLNNVPLTGYGHKINNIHFFNDTSIISIVKTASDDQTLLHNQDIKIDDILSFRHKDGTITSTKVLSFANPIVDQQDEPPTLHGALNAEELLSGVTDNPRAFQRKNNNTVEINWAMNIDGIYDSGVTTLLVPDTIPIADFQSNPIIANIEQIIPSDVWGVETTITTQPNDLYVSAIWLLNDLEEILSGSDLSAYAGYNVIQISSYSGNQVFSGLSDITPEVALDNVNQLIFQPDANNQYQLPFTITYLDRTGYYEVDREVWKYPVQLSWFNCYTFGNGVESDRIRDDFNAPQIDNGNRVSTTFSGYGKENKSSGMIYSGLYNSTSEVNELNEFNMSEKITKDLNPSYGSIQRLKTRDTDLVTLTEDKVLKIIANKDAVYNADGNPQLIATNRVLGTAVPFIGDFGISKNPESLAWDQFRMYFTDTQRGAVLRLSRDGLTPISNIGMKTWFRDNIAKERPKRILGTFDIVNGEYNITMNYGNISNLNDQTISFNEVAKGFVSFKSFIPEHGVSVSGKYFTTKHDKIYEHYSDSVGRNTFYGGFVRSSVDIMFNEMPGIVKSFRTINYEGSQARITQSYNISTATTYLDVNNNEIPTTDNEYYNLVAKKGWWASNIETDLQEGEEIEFKDKENKWFNNFKGLGTTLANLDTKEFSVQGLGQLIDIVPPDEDGFVLGGCSEEGYILDENTGECIPEYVEIVYGCMDPLANNYNIDANVDDPNNPCCYTGGCMDNTAFNYNPDACYDDGTCAEVIYGCVYGGSSDYSGAGPGFGLPSGPFPDIYGNNQYGNPCEYPCELNNEGVMVDAGYEYYGVNPNANIFNFDYCSQPVGCGNPLASNYIPSIAESTLAVLNPTTGLPQVSGGPMVNNTYENYNWTGFTFYAPWESGFDGINQWSLENYLDNPHYTIQANAAVTYFQNENLCEFIYGCTDSSACNYNVDATLDDGSCIYVEAGYDCDGNCLNDSDGDGVCDDFEIYGCTDASAFNYNSDATEDDGSCEAIIFGCLEEDASNYYLPYIYANTNNPDLCFYDIFGCTEETTTIENAAGELVTYENTNYDPDATINDGSCTYEDVIPLGSFGVINNESDSLASILPSESGDYDADGDGFAD